MEIKKATTYTLVLNQEEYKLLRAAIGDTSFASRLSAGMTREGAQFMEDLFSKLDEVYKED